MVLTITIGLPHHLLDTITSASLPRCLNAAKHSTLRWLVTPPTTISKMTAGARCAIKMHSKTKDVQQLRSDFRNGPNHVFNNHSYRNPSFCKIAAAEEGKTSINDENSDPSNTIEEDEVCGDEGCGGEDIENSTLSNTIDTIIEEVIEDEVHISHSLTSRFTLSSDASW